MYIREMIWTSIFWNDRPTFTAIHFSRRATVWESGIDNGM